MKYSICKYYLLILLVCSGSLSIAQTQKDNIDFIDSLFFALAYDASFQLADSFLHANTDSGLQLDSISLVRLLFISGDVLKMRRQHDSSESQLLAAIDMANRIEGYSPCAMLEMLTSISHCYRYKRNYRQLSIYIEKADSLHLSGGTACDAELPYFYYIQGLSYNSLQQFNEGQQALEK